MIGFVVLLLSVSFADAEKEEDKVKILNDSAGQYKEYTQKQKAAEGKAQENELSIQGKISETQQAYINKELVGKMVVGGIQINVNDSTIIEGKRSFDELNIYDRVAVIYYHFGEENIAKKISFLGGKTPTAAVSINTNSQEIVTDTKEGDIELIELAKDEFYTEKIPPLSLGKKVPTDFYIYLQEEKASKEIVVVALIHPQGSPSGTHMAFHVIFYDSTGNIVGVVNSFAGTKPDYQYSLRGNTNGIPLKRIQEIKSYKLIYYQWN